jgi:prephenate dehydratase
VLTSRVMNNNATIAISAIAGSFTEEAASQYLLETNTRARFVYVGTARNAFENVATGHTIFGIIPIRNSNAGFVLDNLKASADFTYKIVHIFSLSVHQNLLVLPGTKTVEITTICSQLPAIAQCEAYLSKSWPNTDRQEYIDTALAARDLSLGKITPSTAVIASRTAADLYHLDILASDIQTDKQNYTEFMVITRHDSQT